MTPTEFWLPVGAAALYLYDSVVPLWQNELVYQRAAGRWRVLAGPDILLRGRRMLLPNPATPQWPLFRVRWTVGETKQGQQPAIEPAPLLRALRPIGALNLLQLMLLCALPMVLWMVGPAAALLVFVLFYLLTLGALVLAWRSRSALGLSGKDYSLLMLDVMACAPFAINMTRRLATRHGLAGEPLRFAARHFDDAAVVATGELVSLRVRQECAASGASSADLLGKLLPRLRRPSE